MQVCRFPRKLFNGTNVYSQNIVAILNPKTEDCADIKDRTVNTLKQDDSRSDYCAWSIDYEGNLGKLIYPIDFLNSLSSSGLPPHKPNLNINNFVISFIFQNLKCIA
jgi:hypothetical protein